MLLYSPNLLGEMCIFLEPLFFIRFVQSIIILEMFVYIAFKIKLLKTVLLLFVST